MIIEKVNSKRCSAKPIFLNENQFEKDLDDSCYRKLSLKVHFWKILRMDLELCLFTKNIIFSWSMFKFEQKCNQSRNPTDNKCLLVAWRWNIWNLVSHDFVFFFTLTRNTLHTYWRARDIRDKTTFFQGRLSEHVMKLGEIWGCCKSCNVSFAQYFI